MQKVRITRIPKDLLSERFRQMPLKKQVALRNRMKLESVSLYSETKKVSDDVNDLNVRLSESQLSQKPIELKKVKKEIDELLKRRKAIKGRIYGFCQCYRGLFTEFEPMQQGQSAKINSVERTVHEAWQQGNHFDYYIENAQRLAGIIKGRRRGFLLERDEEPP